MNSTQKLVSNERPVLKQQDQGEWVTCLQDALNGCGFGPLDLDGDFGVQTLSVVVQLQHKNSLLTTGIVDAATWSAIATHEKQFGWQPQWPSEAESTGIVGADTLKNATSALILEASNYLAATPQFWGRYFQGDSSEGEYLHDIENAPLQKAGVRVLPISRQTDRVGLSRQTGAEMGQLHAEDLLETFGENYLAAQGDGFYFFLDVELQHPLSQEFYSGWSEAVFKASSKVRLMPCVYLNHADYTTLSNLSTAVKAGAECHGLWVANYGHNDHARPQPWNSEAMALARPAPCKVLLHQYRGDMKGGYNDASYDFSQINPFLEHPESVLKRLILPPQP